MKLLQAGAVILAFCVAAFHAEAAFYLRPTCQVFVFTDTDVDSELGSGGGVALGGAFGRDQRFEVGAEITLTRAHADFYQGSYNSQGMYQRGSTKSEHIVNMKTALATFRYCFGTKGQVFRPFWDLGLGFSAVDVSNEGDGVCVRAALGGGVSCRLGRLTRLDFGYRYVYSSKVGDLLLEGSWGPDEFSPSAHVFSIALDQRF